MNRTVIMICMSIGMTLGAFIPALWGDHDLLSGGSILWGLIGGIVGIWIGSKLARQLWPNYSQYCNNM